MFGAAHFRQPCLSRLSSPDAALCLPALGGTSQRNRGAEARLGETEPAAGLRNAAGRRTADLAPDGTVVTDGPTTMEQDASMTSSQTMRSMRDFVRDERGATAIEYALIASGIAGAIIAVVMTMGTSLQAMYTSVSNGFN